MEDGRSKTKSNLNGQQLKNTKLLGEIVSVDGSNTNVLNNPQQIWVVHSGAVALFSVAVKNGAPIGNRRYLFTCEAGEAFFGSAIVLDTNNLQILAVPIGKTELIEVKWQHWQKLVETGNEEVKFFVENWLQKFNGLLADIESPTSETKVGEQARLSIDRGQIVRSESGKLVWIQLAQGKVRWMGYPDLNLTSKSAIFPLSEGMWLETEEDIQLKVEVTTAIVDANALSLGLSQLHQYFLYYLKLQKKQESLQELERLRLQDRLNRQVTEEAIGELAAPLAPKAMNFFLHGTPLLVAVGAVGKSLGATIRPPSKSEDLNRFKQPLEAIARSSRLRMRQVLLRDDWWKEDCGAMMGYTIADDRPVALLPRGGSSYELLDPVTQERTKIDANLAETISPVAYSFYRSLPDRVLKVFDIIRFAIKGLGKDLLIILLTGIAGVLLGMVTPQATSIIIDSAIPNSDRGLLLQIGLGLIVAAFGTSLFKLNQGFSLLKVETVSDVSTQSAIWDRLLNLPVSFFREYTIGDLHSRVSAVGEIRQQLGGNTLVKLVTGIFALFNLALLFFYNVKLAFIAVAAAILTVIVTVVSGILMLRRVKPLHEIEGNIFGITVQLIDSISKLRTTGSEQRAFAFWSKTYSKQIKFELSTQAIEDFVALYNTIMPTITNGILFFFVVQALNEAQSAGKVGLTIGTFMAFDSAFKSFIEGATDVSNTFTDMLQILPQWERAQPILEKIPEISLDKADPGKLTGKITVDRVSFRYREDGPLNLDKVSINAEPGEFIALVGGSGSGKSTIFRLLLGFETPEEGSVYYDGQDLFGLDVGGVRRQLGVVLQAGKLMSGSIFDNLAGGANITLDEAWEAAKMSGFADDVEAMPMGMHTVVSEGGGNLSGGQRQRLLIAKALVLKPHILLFDEATSALDNRTQAIVSENLDKLKVTRLVIAHRLSTIRNADRIYVMQSGCVIQQGGFDELAKQEGLFANLMQRQMV
jgi:NHLM bacteriocin system ABC transporter ATP-binding protein